MPRLNRTSVASLALAAAFALAACGGGGTAPTSSGLSTGAVTTDTLLQSAVPLTGPEPVTVLQAQFGAVDRDARRLVRATLNPASVDDRLFIGQSVVCTSAEGLVRTSPELGRELEPGQPVESPIVTELVLQTSQIGAWTCAAALRVCPPTSCATTDAAAGTLTIAGAESAAPSVLSISAPLPEWAVQEPAGQADVVARPGAPGVLVTEVPAPVDQGALDVSGFVAMRVCTGESLPEECPGTTPGGVNIVPTVTVAQGGACATTTATAAQGAVPQRLLPGERFATSAFVIPEFGMSTAAGCTPTLTVTISIAVEGAPVVLQRGSTDLPTALVAVTPANP